MATIYPDGTYDVPCAECGQPFDFGPHLQTADECERTMRADSNGERGCSNRSEHHVYTAATPRQLP